MAGCGGTDVAQEFTLVQSPLLREHKNVHSTGTEGRWTPTLTITPTAGDLSVTYATRLGTYTKIGRSVFLTFYIVTQTFTHTTASGDVIITGIPYGSIADQVFSGSVIWSGVTAAGFTDAATVKAVGTDYLNVWLMGSGAGIQVLSEGEVPTGGTVILGGTIMYLAEQ